MILRTTCLLAKIFQDMEVKLLDEGEKIPLNINKKHQVTHNSRLVIDGGEVV